MGGLLKWGYPNSWMVWFRENPNLKWLMTGGTPRTQETSILILLQIHSAAGASHVARDTCDLLDGANASVGFWKIIADLTWNIYEHY